MEKDAISYTPIKDVYQVIGGFLFHPEKAVASQGQNWNHPEIICEPCHAEGSGTRDELFIAGGSPQRINQINRNNQSQIINQYVNQSNQSQDCI